MKRALLALLLAALALLGACTPDEDNTGTTYACDADFAAAIHAVAGQLNDFYGCPGPGDTASTVVACIETAGSSACTMQTVDACAAAAGDTDCNTCAKTRCCSDVVGFLIDPTSLCLVDCQVGGAALDACSTSCGAGPDPAYDGLAACITDHCASQCAGLGLQ